MAPKVAGNAPVRRQNSNDRNRFKTGFDAVPYSGELSHDPERYSIAELRLQARER